MGLPLQFDATLPGNGYEWKETTGVISRKPVETRRRRFLTSAPDGEGHQRLLSSDSDASLFRQFADLQPNEEAVRDFANDYGLLGVNQVDIVSSRRGDEPGHRYQKGEDLDTWSSEIGELSHLLQLSDRLRVGDDAWIGSFLHEDLGIEGLPEPVKLVYTPPPSRSLSEVIVASESMRPQLLSDFRRGEWAPAALYALCELVSQKLKEHPVELSLRPGRGRHKTEEVLTTKNMASFMWLQFEAAVDGEKEYRQCEQCRKWYEVSAEVREGAKYCRTACRTKAHRRKIARAKKLYESGHTPEAIAGLLDSAEEVVKGWVSK